MLLEFGAKNFFSFKEGFEVSLRLGDSCPKKISKNKSYANVLAVKGANASGKTNVLKVLSFLREFVTNSFNTKPDQEIKFDSYFMNDDLTEIYIIFLDDNIEYRYELSLTSKKIVTEVMYRKDKRDIKIFERKDNKIYYRIDEFKELDIIKLRDNASIISTANQYSINKIKLIYNLFNHIITNVYQLGRDDNHLDYGFMSKIYAEDDSLFTFVKEILIDSDTGIENIEIKKIEEQEGELAKYFPVFIYEVNESRNFLTYHEQSSGTKALYTQLGLYKFVLDNGGVLALDEFDVNLHSDLLPMLISLFENEEKNPNNAQLIFTTHHTDIMDKLGKYRVVLVNKEDNESFLYRLDEIPGDMLRNDRSIVQKYKENKIGGKPKIRV